MEIYQFTLAGALVSQFDVEQYGVLDPESVEFVAESGTLLILSNHMNRSIIETTTSGILLRTMDVSAANGVAPAGLAYAPASNGSGVKHFYIVDRGIDNNINPNSIDGKLFEMTAPVPLAPGFNTPPIVNAGTDQTIVLPNNALLDGTVSDDGLPNPPATLSMTWSQINGPGLATFGNANATDTTVAFSLPGDYILRLSAFDGELTTGDNMAVNVVGNGAVNSFDLRIAASADDAEENASNSVSLTSPDLDMLLDGSGTSSVTNLAIGLRFIAIPLPRGALISNAYLQFETDEVS